ncbi:MAG: PEP-CTERM sorting domain-containing protein [Bryobacteraceae bacterium]
MGRKFRPAVIGAVAIVITAAMGVRADGATLDFSVFASGNTGLSVLDVGAATVTISGGTVFVYRPGDFGAFTTSGGLCALSGGSCQTDWRLDFDFGVTNLMFESAFFNPVDFVSVEYFDGATSLGSIPVAANGTFDLSSVPRITSLVFNDSSTGAGFGFGDFSFDRAGSAIPEPATLLLLGMGLAAIAYRRRRTQ